MSNLPVLNPFSDEFLKSFGKGREEVSELIERSKILKVKVMLRPNDVRPDSYGCDCLFCRYFITDEMALDFPVIANRFLAYAFLHASDYSMNYDRRSQYTDTPSHFLQKKILSMMMLAAKNGSDFAADVLCALYKTYYKKEYKQIKRFRSLEGDDVMALVHDDPASWYGMARVLFMASILHIEIGPSCDFLYAFLNDYNEREEKVLTEAMENAQIPDGLYSQCRQWVLEQLEAIDLSDGRALELKAFRLTNDFIRQVFDEHGYCEYFGDKYEFYSMRTFFHFSHTLAFLKKQCPRRAFTLVEIQLYSAIYAVISACCGRLDELNDEIDRMLGLFNEDYGEDYPEPRFEMKLNPFSCNTNTPGGDANPSRYSTNATGTTADPSGYNVNAPDGNANLQTEVHRLREMLHKKEQDCRHFKTLYTECRQKNSLLNENLKQYENDRDELVALRNHIYQYTQDDLPLPPKDIEMMKSALAGKRIIIIGGHSNWTYKLKNLFPGWTFIKPGNSGTISERILDHSDYVYFFTDCIRHCTYLRFIKTVRDHSLPFGYIHSIHIPSNIEQIYKDLGLPC